MPRTKAKSRKSLRTRARVTLVSVSGPPGDLTSALRTQEAVDRMGGLAYLRMTASYYERNALFHKRGQWRKSPAKNKE